MKLLSFLNRRTILRLIGIIVFAVVLYLADIKSVFSRIDLTLGTAIAIGMIPVFSANLLRAIRFRAITTILLGSQKFADMLHAAVVEAGFMQISSLLAPPVKLLYVNSWEKKPAFLLQAVFVDKVYEYILPFYFGIGSLLILYAGRSENLLIAIWLILLFFIRKPISLLFMKSLVILSKISSPLKKLKPMMNELLANKNKTEQSLGWVNYICTIVTTAMFYLCFYMIAQYIDIPLTFAQLFIILTLSTFVGILPFTFMGLGMRDVGLASMFYLYGRPIEDAVVLSLGMLGIRIVTLCIGGLWWLVFPPAKPGRDRTFNVNTSK